MAAKGAKLTAFVLRARNSGLVLGSRRALAAFERGDVDALSLLGPIGLDPIVMDLEQRGLVTALAGAGDSAGDRGAARRLRARSAAVPVCWRTMRTRPSAPEEKGRYFLVVPICSARVRQSRETLQHDSLITLGQADAVRGMPFSLILAVATAWTGLPATFVKRCTPG